MFIQSRNKMTRKISVGLVSLAGVGLSAATAASPSAASPAERGDTQSTTVTQTSGSGTVSDPWSPPRNAHTDCQSTGLYGNYDGLHHDWIYDMPFNKYIVVRYVTSDGRSADVLNVENGVSQWGFASTACWHFT